MRDACLRQSAIHTKRFEAQIELFVPAAAEVTGKANRMGNRTEKCLMQSIPWNTQVDLYLMLSLIHC